MLAHELTSKFRWNKRINTDNYWKSADAADDKRHIFLVTLPERFMARWFWHARDSKGWSVSVFQYSRKIMPEWIRLGVSHFYKTKSRHKKNLICAYVN